jgi:hypothetical protein
MEHDATPWNESLTTAIKNAITESSYMGQIVSPSDTTPDGL